MAQKDSTLDLMRQWTEINQNLWTNWLNSTQHLSKGPAGLDEAYHQQLKGMQKMVDDTMKLERRWVALAKEQAAQNQAAQPAVKMMADFAETALDTRSKVWTTIFDNAQAVDLSTPANAMGTLQGPQEFMASLREFAERMMGAQASAAKATTKAAGAAQAAATEAAGKAAGSEPPAKQAKTG